MSGQHQRQFFFDKWSRLQVVLRQIQLSRHAKMVEQSSTVINHAETWTPGVCRQEQIRLVLGSPHPRRQQDPSCSSLQIYSFERRSITGKMEGTTENQRTLLAHAAKKQGSLLEQWQEWLFSYKFAFIRPEDILAWVEYGLNIQRSKDKPPIASGGWLQ